MMYASTHTRHEIDRQERRADAVQLAAQNLYDEACDALMHDPSRELRTPGYSRTKSAPAWSLLSYLTDAQQEELANILMRASKSGDPMAQLLIGTISNEYSATHAEESAEESAE